MKKFPLPNEDEMKRAYAKFMSEFKPNLVQKSLKLSWNTHKNHYELIKEFYALNKYLISEQLKDALLDAIECMEYTMTAEGEEYKEDKDNG